MTIGIYKLEFNNTNKVYIGQSSNIEKRWISHISNLNLGKATKKLQEAHNLYGINTYSIVLECTIEELDKAEAEAIEIFDSYNKGFNSTNSATGPCFKGQDNASAREDNATYELILKLLVQVEPTLDKRTIAELCNVSIYVVRHIAALESHTWLKEKFPIEYALLEKQKALPYYYGTQYPKLLSPEGVIWDITHITNFSKQHNLLQPKVTEVLRGTRKSHKGWTRVGG